jgi:hypothetical protein
MSWSFSVMGKTRQELRDAVATAVARADFAPKDGRIESSVCALLDAGPQVEYEGKVFYAASHGHLEQDGSGIVELSVGTTAEPKE